MKTYIVVRRTRSSDGLTVFLEGKPEDVTAPPEPGRSVFVLKGDPTWWDAVERCQKENPQEETP